MNKTIVTLTGPSASGKSHLEKKLVESGHFYKAVSTTTREPRPGEIEGVDYFFITHEQFVEKNRNGDFIESVYFSGNGYAVDISEINKAFEANKHVAIVCEPQGAKQIRRYCAHHKIPSLKAFITNSEEVLLNRFVQREFVGLLKPVHIRYKSQRLTNLIEDELSWEREGEWDMVIDHYDVHNEKEILDLVLNRADATAIRATIDKGITAA